MSLSGVSLLAILGLLSALYVLLVLRRNRRLVRPPILGFDGSPIPAREFRFSDGETVDYVDLRPSEAGAKGEAQSSFTILFIPGADGMKETFRYQVPALARRHRVICASLRRRLSSGHTLDRLVDDVGELAVSSGARRVLLVGQSFGGSVAMRFAVRWPEKVAGLVLVNTLARIGYDHVGLNRTLLAPVARFTTRYLPTRAARALARIWSRLEVWIYDDSPGSERVVDYALWTGTRTVPSSESNTRVNLLKKMDLRGQLPSIEASTLVIKGPRDHYVPPAWSHEIVALIPGATYVEVAGTGHCSHLSMPGSFNRILEHWLTEVGE